MRIVRDQDCPQCQWPETYTEVDEKNRTAVGCSKCGWREVRSRQCFYIPEGQFDDNGYIPSLVTENEPGHRPLTGNGRFSSPWYWGKTYEKAREICAEENKKLGLTEEDVVEIVASSIGASR